MKNLFKALSVCALILQLNHTTKGQSTDSTAFIIKQISSQENDILKWKFTLAENSMWYWYETTTDLRLRDSLQTEMINTYQRITGIAAITPTELLKVHEIQKAMNQDCNSELNKAIDLSKKYERRKNFWKTTTIVGIPIGIIGGVLGTIYILK